jgi:NADP-dependent 3-hydroxy acid dehydrogenase YdfG
MVQNFKDKFGPLLISEDVAEAIYFMVSQKPHVHISDIVVRPTRQDYP